MKPYFIDENINVLMGDSAIEALSKENDEKFLSTNKGVLKVSTERWEKAQACEKKHWLIKGIKSIDDRNHYHFIQFNKYEDIRNNVFDSVLEIGCGPFTNLRIIASICKISNCDLLDPLIDDYLKHPFCAYSKKYLFSEYFSFIGKAISRISPFAYKYYLNILTKKVNIGELMNIPAEIMPLTNKYDLVTMINVIEHCYDAEEVFENILKTTEKGSYFIFSDKFYYYEQIIKEIKLGYDAAHPLKVDRQVVETFLYDNFEIVYKRIQTNTMVLEGEKFQWDDIYFIGKKK